MDRNFPFATASLALRRTCRLVVCAVGAWGVGWLVVRGSAAWFPGGGEAAYRVGQIVGAALIPVFIVVGFGWRRYGFVWLVVWLAALGVAVFAAAWVR